MIAYIKGLLISKNPTYVIIETSGGVGYRIEISLHTYSQISDNSNIKLNTYLSIKEDSHCLYGFMQEDELALFTNLISVSGVGTNTARTILSSMSPNEVEQAIINGDVSTLKRIKGIGEKSAQRLILDLKDKLSKNITEGKTISLIANTQNSSKNDALSALLALGFAKPLAEKTIDSILKKNPEGLTTENLIKAALSGL